MLKEKFRKQDNRIGAQPINWSNDDFKELGAGISLESCLSEMHEAGYSGTEFGNKFTKTPALLRPLLQKYGLQLISAWHGAYLASRDFDEEKIRFLDHLKFLKEMGSNITIVAELTHCVYDDPGRPLEFANGTDKLSEKQWDRLASGLGALGNMAKEYGFHMVYHQHMGTVIQNWNELKKLTDKVPELRLLFDTGHLTFAGIDPLEFIDNYGDRIGHVHLKNVRPQIVQLARSGHWSFEKSVKEGVFTVPGDGVKDEGSVDYLAVFERLANLEYKGWLVVEAEQDPQKANPLQYAKLARNFIRETIGL